MPRTDEPPLEGELFAAHRAGMTLPEWRDKRDREAELEVDPDALEKDEQREVMKMYRAHGCVVRNLSQARKTKQAPGLPDLFVVHRGKSHAWWHETKRPVGGRYSPAQLEFRDDMQACGVGWVGGDRRAAAAQLRAIGAVVDLMDALKTSLAASNRGTSSGGTAP